MSDVECSVGGVAEVSHGAVKETHDEATAWFWFASWPVIWEMMDRFAGYMFSMEWQIVVRRVCILFGLVIINLWWQVWPI